MSQAFNQTSWTFTLQTSQGSAYDQTNWTAYAQNGMTDSWANAIYQALKAVTPPPGSQLQISVSKQNVVDTSYTTDTSTNPITFN